MSGFGRSRELSPHPPAFAGNGSSPALLVAMVVGEECFALRSSLTLGGGGGWGEPWDVWEPSKAVGVQAEEGPEGILDPLQGSVMEGGRKSVLIPLVAECEFILSPTTGIILNLFPAHTLCFLHRAAAGPLNNCSVTSCTFLTNSPNPLCLLADSCSSSSWTTFVEGLLCARGQESQVR